ncbi:16S rRNA (cytosine(1402)-N(4))-methyltransferase [Bacillus sp. M6-12]|uniref:class I SAM-dependent methyltransferase n=1 Tax=Bacillus sp. M6-12 TaxID=2054166 RepID=UPI000C75811C|nr:rRNA adenine N-6-methyltransferase family protein [Bacillus sp. M6-12]PLS19370.1 16S rRNA (cytosine(1402)-N(4))-methyltransferase [Bacillus sp. M6-12]
MKNLLFVIQYLLKPRTVGAVLPSSKKLAKKMMENVEFEHAKCIVEYGPGTGVFTEQILKNRKKETVVILIEHNHEFCELLQKRYKGEKNLYIVHDSAEKIDHYLEEHNINQVDYVVSGLPFASLPKAVSSNILNKTKEILGEEGKFITFQYTLLKKDFIQQYFETIQVKRELINMPPAYVFCCQLS